MSTEKKRFPKRARVTLLGCSLAIKIAWNISKKINLTVLSQKLGSKFLLYAKTFSENREEIFFEVVRNQKVATKKKCFF